MEMQAQRAVEASPEKAGVGGSTPSLATIFQSTWIEINQLTPSPVYTIEFTSPSFQLVDLFSPQA
jgi:hypothetical protein